MEKFFSRIRMGDFEFKNIEVYKITFSDGNIVDYSECGRTKHLIHYITLGERSYEINGEYIRLKENTLLLIPEGTKYITESHRTFAGNCAGIGISFCCENLFLKEEQDIFFKQNLHHSDKIAELFENCFSAYKTAPLDRLSLKVAFYNLFSYLVNMVDMKSEEYILIKPALEFITANFDKNLPVKQYSERCNLSESYLRKKFAEYMGMSPIDYRNKLRFSEAKRLYFEGLSSQQIAEKLGFCDSNYFLKQYKKYVGESLKNDSKMI